MVRLGFIVEGDTEKIMIESARFRNWANAQGLEICSPVINAKGGGNLLPQHMGPMVATLAKSQPDHVVVLTDLDNAPDIAAVKARITTAHTSLIFVAVKALEAWFLADTKAMRAWLKQPDFEEALPEQTPAMPWDWLKEVARQQGARGPGSNKVLFAKRFCGTHDFQVANAAAHPACPSAKALHDALLDLSLGAGLVGN
ncbi:hypothetical protein [Sphaerotilus sp.]|uniref:hypothetical protein n=1 Tax=Sphaerotilus sp. TaxID=2093942 RepID=UPI002ACE8C0C|nr:hypothetical protein [Sphaerotilus sp.]